MVIAKLNITLIITEFNVGILCPPQSSCESCFRYMESLAFSDNTQYHDSVLNVHPCKDDVNESADQRLLVLFDHQQISHPSQLADFGLNT